MHNERLKRIAKFLGKQGLYKEAGNLAKVAQSQPDYETYDEREEAYRKSIITPSTIAEELNKLNIREKSYSLILLNQDKKMLEDLVIAVKNIYDLLKGKGKEKTFIKKAVNILIDNENVYSLFVDIINSDTKIEDIKNKLQEQAQSQDSSPAAFPDPLYPW